MKNHFIVIFYFLILTQLSHTITKNTSNYSGETSYTIPCQQCINSLQEAKQYIFDLEKRLHIMQEDLRKWMKAYSDEVSTKSSFYQKSLDFCTDMYNKYVSTEIKLSNKK